MKIIFGTDTHAKEIWVKYLVVNSPNSYNIIIGRPTFKLLGAFQSIKFLVMKYPLDNGRIRMIKGDQKIAKGCYHNNLRLQKGKKKGENNKPHNVNMIDLDSREEYQQECLEPTKT